MRRKIAGAVVVIERGFIVSARLGVLRWDAGRGSWTDEEGE